MSRHPLALRTPRTVALIVALLGCAIAIGAALFTPLAGAATVQEASLSMSSDEGDYIGQGQTYAYDSAAGDGFNSTTTAGTVEASVQAANGDWWYLRFGAPQGETLAAGTYADATRFWSGDPTQPGLDVFGNGRGCNTLTGSFTVTQITFGADAAVESFDADFEQHCEGATAALRGHLHLVNAPAPPPLAIDLGLASAGRADRVGGAAHVSGTITCNRPTTVYLSGRLTQRATRFAQATGSFSLAVPCSGTTAWQADVRSENSVPFGAGSAQLTVNASAFDPETGQATDSDSATVKLTR